LFWIEEQAAFPVADEGIVGETIPDPVYHIIEFPGAMITLAMLNMPVEALRRSHTVTSFEPFTLLSALAAVTERIGLVA
ncbi:hypothetical protein AB9F39_38735, partial [Rhizobium leguminosarum]